MGIHPLKDYRERSDLTQLELARQLGVTRETVARWETGRRKIDPARAARISEATGVPRKELRPDVFGDAQ